MIEVIYDKKAEQEENDREHTGDRNTVKLPKNIRQIGNPQGNRRIYIEDYVVTYLNYIARPGSTQARGAILLGSNEKTEIGDVIFISGAVEAQNLEFDMDESEFTQEVWTDIYEQVKEFFPELSVVGWFLSRMGFSTAINDKIEKLHTDNFPGRDKVLYVTDSLESDDAFYMYEKGQLVKQKGYYIYYTKNESMQNYIIKQKGGVTDENNTEIKRKDEELIRNYREKNSKIQGSRAGGISLAYVASSFVVLAMLAMGVTVISNYDRMKDMEVSINKLELTADDTSDLSDNDAVAEVLANGDDYGTVASGADAPASEDDTDAGKSEDIVTDNVTESTSEITTAVTTEQNISTEQTIPAMTDDSPVYYTIKYGDSLGSIALEYYGAIRYAEDIARANNMDMNEKIYEGQQIVLPPTASQ